MEDNDNDVISRSLLISPIPSVSSLPGVFPNRRIGLSRHPPWVSRIPLPPPKKDHGAPLPLKKSHHLRIPFLHHHVLSPYVTGGMEILISFSCAAICIIFVFVGVLLLPIRRLRAIFRPTLPLTPPQPPPCHLKPQPQQRQQ